MFRLIEGPSGSGKTTRVCQEIIDRSLTEQGRHFFILVPDQFTMQTQMDVVRMHPGKGIMNIDVLSFSRLTHRVFDETGAPKEQVMDDLGKSLLLRRTAQTLAKELPVIGSGMQRAGYVDEVKSVISEFMQYGISPDGLQALIDKTGDRKALQARLTDLQKLYRAFLDAISHKYLTSEELLTVTARRIPQSKLFKDAVIAVDGFTGFTPVQYELLAALYARAAEMTFTFTNRDDAEAAGGDLFALTSKTINDLTRHLWEEECRKHPQTTPPLDVWSAYRREHAGDVFLGREGGAFPHKSQALIHLEKNLFAHPAFPYEEKTDDFELVCTSNVREEVRQTFRAIHAKLREDKSLMYRDFAIVCADQETYADTIRHMADIFDIPIYEDKTRGARRNPVFEYLRSILEIMRTSFDTDAVMQYLRSGLAPFDETETAILDNYVTARRIRGKKAWNTTFYHPYSDKLRRESGENEKLYAIAEDVRGRLSQALSGMLRAFSQKEDAQSVTKELYLLMEQDGVAKRLQQYEQAFLEEGKEAEASEYGQIYAKLVTFLDALYGLLEGEKLSAREYAEILEAGFSELKVGTIPQSVDRVQVGDLERTRLRSVKHLYFLGTHDGVIPGGGGGGGVLSEIDREYLRGVCPEVELAPMPAELMNMQSLYLYMMMAKPMQSLTVSWPKQDGKGASLRAAYIVPQLQKIFPQVPVRYPEKESFLSRTESKKDLYRRLSPLFRLFAAGFRDQEEEDNFLDACHILTETDDEARLLLMTRTEAAFEKYTDKLLEEDLANALYAGNPRGSVSRLELFASCAYAHFLKYGLRLAERASGMYSAADLGTIYHAALEVFAKGLAEAGLEWKTFTDRQVSPLLEKAVEDCVRGAEGIVLETKKDLFELERIKRILHRTVMTMQYQLQKGDFVPFAMEQDFQQNGMRGRIDRIDLARDEKRDLIKIVDYKSGRRDFDAASMYYGLQMQLITYMDAVLEAAEKEKREREPAALLYYRVTDPMINGDTEHLMPGTSAAEITALKRSALKTTGLVNADGDVLKKLDKDMKDKSDVIPLKNTFEGNEYELLSKHVAALEKEFTIRIAKGDVSCFPALGKNADACKYCPYKSICGFDTGVPGFEKRELEELDMSQVLEKIREGEEEHR